MFQARTELGASSDAVAISRGESERHAMPALPLDKAKIPVQIGLPRTS